ADGGADNDYIALNDNGVADVNGGAISLGGNTGDDIIVVGYNGLDSSGDISVTGDAGKDDIRLTGSRTSIGTGDVTLTAGSISISAGSEDDLITLVQDTTFGTRTIDISGNNTIAANGDAGDDQIWIASSNAQLTGGTISLAGGTGNDTISGALDSLTGVSNTLTFDGGDDDDLLIAAGELSGLGTGDISLTNSRISLNGGSDQDRIIISAASSVVLPVNISLTGTSTIDAVGGSGNDTLEITAHDLILVGGWMNLDGGTGNDTINGAFNLDATNTTITAAGGDNDDVILLAGNNTVTTGGEISLIGTTINLLGNDGDDLVQLTDRLDQSGIFPPTVTLDGSSTIIIDGGADDDQVQVGGDEVDLVGGTVSLLGGTGNDTINVASVEVEIDGTALLIDGGEGDDTIGLAANRSDVEAGTTISLAGGAGNDSIDIYTLGTWFNSVTPTIDGGSGNDTIRGSFVDDLIYGGQDEDSINGDSGNDTIFGGLADDTLSGGDEDDRIFGDEGMDLIYGGNQDDTLRGGDDQDAVFGDAGVDLIYGGDGGDTLSGGDDADRLFGELGTDLIYGGIGDDTVNAGNDDDTIFGDQGADLIYGGNDIDTMSYIGSAAGVQVGIGTGIAGAGGDAQGDLLYEIENLVGTSQADSLAGTGGDNTIWGEDGNDFINLASGGTDDGRGGAGDDAFYFGDAFDVTDRVDGGSGIQDQIGLQGDYSAGVTFGPQSTLGIETVALLPGNLTAFGAPGTDFYSYDLTLVDANIQAGEEINFAATTLRLGENFTLDASAELDGNVFTFGGFGTDLITGSQQDDSFYFGGERFSILDEVDGEGGFDAVGLQGDFSAGITLGANQLTDIELIAVLSSADVRFGSTSFLPFSYDITTVDANVVSGGSMFIVGNALLSTELLTFDGSAETDGGFTVYAGAANDLISGSQTDDILFGFGGADQLQGNNGNNTLLYLLYSNSNLGNEDTILDFEVGDVMDLAGLDANLLIGGDQAFNFINDLAFSNTAGELRAENLVGNDWVVQADADGDGFADLIINVTTPDADPITAGDFLL
ncbi:MAG: calcium-binding protein, partial [Pseudomonadota bacterium]